MCLLKPTTPAEAWDLLPDRKPSVPSSVNSDGPHPAGAVDTILPHVALVGVHGLRVRVRRLRTAGAGIPHNKLEPFTMNIPDLEGRIFGDVFA